MPAHLIVKHRVSDICPEAAEQRETSELAGRAVKSWRAKEGMSLNRNNFPSVFSDSELVYIRQTITIKGKRTGASTKRIANEKRVQMSWVFRIFAPYFCGKIGLPETASHLRRVGRAALFRVSGRSARLHPSDLRIGKSMD